MERLYMRKEAQRNNILFNADYLGVLFAAKAAQNSLFCFVGYLYRTHITIYASKCHFVCQTTACYPLAKPEFSYVFKAKAILGCKTWMTSRLPPAKSRNFLIL